MTRNIADADADVSLHAYVKELSGRRIEMARKRVGMTQRELAKELGMGVRWLREVESGNPRATLDDHLRCTYHLGFSTGHIVIPLMFQGQKMSYPAQLAVGDLQEMERLCIEIIAERSLAQLTRQLTPRWKRSSVLSAGS